MRFLVVLTAVATLGFATPHGDAFPPEARRFAAPGVIVFTGTLLHSRVVLSDWAENQRLMSALSAPTDMSAARGGQRPSIAIAMYWGGEWSRYAATPDSLALLARIHPPQPGRFYPASHGSPALWEFGAVGGAPASTRVVSDEAAAILRKHGVPLAVTGRW